MNVQRENKKEPALLQLDLAVVQLDLHERAITRFPPSSLSPSVSRFCLSLAETPIVFIFSLNSHFHSLSLF